MKSIIILIASIIFSMTGDELSILMENRKAPKDITSELNMEITNKKGRTRKSKIKSKSKQKNKSNALYRFKSRLYEIELQKRKNE